MSDITQSELEMTLGNNVIRDPNDPGGQLGSKIFLLYIPLHHRLLRYGVYVSCRSALRLGSIWGRVSPVFSPSGRFIDGGRNDQS